MRKWMIWCAENLNGKKEPQMGKRNYCFHKRKADRVEEIKNTTNFEYEKKITREKHVT